MPVVGMRMLILTGVGFAWVADVAEQTGPFSFRLENARMLCRTGGVPWDRLADGHDREKATYRQWGEVHVGPQFNASRIWVGELPEVGEV